MRHIILPSATITTCSFTSQIYMYCSSTVTLPLILEIKFYDIIFKTAMIRSTYWYTSCQTDHYAMPSTSHFPSIHYLLPMPQFNQTNNN
jgi:hypothetical protein